MTEGDKYIIVVKNYFEFLITEFDFKISDEKIRSNVFYDVKYTSNQRTISISYENIEDYLQVVIYILEDGEMPNYDDKNKTLHLNRLRTIIFKNINKNEIALNDACFLKFQPKEVLEKELLKSAKELRLCLRSKYYNAYNTPQN